MQSIRSLRDIIYIKKIYIIVKENPGVTFADPVLCIIVYLFVFGVAGSFSQLCFQVVTYCLVSKEIKTVMRTWHVISWIGNWFTCDLPFIT